jgi:endonuclease/exonuclease/phosphatase (EEP) superfamily protein YafD
MLGDAPAHQYGVGASVAGSDPEQRDVRLALATALEWADGAPLVFGGDLNARRPQVHGLTHVAGHHVDHLYARGLAGAAAGETLAHGRLSDHAPLAVALQPAHRDTPSK